MPSSSSTRHPLRLVHASDRPEQARATGDEPDPGCPTAIVDSTDDPLLNPPALTVATVLLTQGMDLQQIRELVAEAGVLADEVCERLQCCVESIAPEQTRELAVGLTALVCADALTSLAQPRLDPTPSGPDLTAPPMTGD